MGTAQRCSHRSHYQFISAQRWKARSIPPLAAPFAVSDIMKRISRLLGLSAIEARFPWWWSSRSPPAQAMGNSADATIADSSSGSRGAAAPSSAILTVPNLLSLLRLSASPYIASLVLSHDVDMALTVFLAAALTDAVDGTLARRLGQTSVLGSYLDPLADKVLVGCTAGSLAYVGSLPPALVALMLGRDAALVAGMEW